jgi:hypothetical protein
VQIETGAQPARRVLEGLLARGASRFGSRVAASSAAGRLSFDKLRHDADEAGIVVIGTALAAMIGEMQGQPDRRVE